MRISQLIQELENVKYEYGDILVKEDVTEDCAWFSKYKDIAKVELIDEDNEFFLVINSEDK